MDETELDNPIWSALRTRHRAFARAAGPALRYPPEVAPFLGIADAAADVEEALETLIAPGDTAYLLGVAPHAPAGWRLKPYRLLAQMIRSEPTEVADGPDIVPLTEAHREDVLALTALVYPHYFRARTMALGRYFGMYVDGRLAAIVGERLATDRYQEISAICTHPDFNGRGYARRMTAMLSNDILAAGRIPFLHVSYENPRAKALYERLGFRTRHDIPFWSLRRA